MDFRVTFRPSSCSIAGYVDRNEEIGSWRASASGPTIATTRGKIWQNDAKWCNNDSLVPALGFCSWSNAWQVAMFPGAVRCGAGRRPRQQSETWQWQLCIHVWACFETFRNVVFLISASQVQIQRSHISSCLPVSRFSLCAANLSRPSFWRPKYLPECPEFPRMDPPLVRTDPFHWLRDDTHENDMPSERCTESWHRCEDVQRRWATAVGHSSGRNSATFGRWGFLLLQGIGESSGTQWWIAQRDAQQPGRILPL